MNLLSKLRNLRSKSQAEEPAAVPSAKNQVSDIYRVPTKAKFIPPRVNGRRVDN